MDERTARAMELVLDAGQTLLENGGEVFRVQDTTDIMARALGVEDFNVYVLSNGIFASSLRGELCMVRHVPQVVIHLGRVEAVNALSRRVAAGELDLEGAERALAAARALPEPPPRVDRLACACGAAGFAYLFGGGVAEALCALAAGFAAQALCRQLARRRVGRLFARIAAAFAATLLAAAAHAALPELDANAAIIGAMMVLAPGVALTNGIRDIINADYISGSIRLLDALLDAGSMACGVALAWLAVHGAEAAAGLSAGAADAPARLWAAAQLAPQWEYPLEFAVAAAATICFGITFRVPRRHYLAGGVTGALGWVVYLACTAGWGLSAPAAVLIAALPLTACARGLAVRRKAPTTVFLIPGIFPLVPGAGIYYTAYYFLDGNRRLFVDKGVETMKIALALSLGIALVCSLPLHRRGRK